WLYSVSEKWWREPANADDRAAEREGAHAKPDHVLAQRRRNHIILAHRTHGAPERRAQKYFQDSVEDQNDREAQTEKPHFIMLLGKNILERPWNAGQSQRAVGEPLLAQDDEPDNLAEAEGENGQIFVRKAQGDERGRPAGSG